MRPAVGAPFNVGVEVGVCKKWAWQFKWALNCCHLSNDRIA